MPKITQTGIAPIIIIGLVALAVATSAGTYFALNMMQPPQKAVNPVQNSTATFPVNEQTTIEEVKAANEPALLEMEGVEKVEVGEKDGKPCVVVFSFKETDELHTLQNNGLSGYEVVVQNTPHTN